MSVHAICGSMSDAVRKLNKKTLKAAGMPDSLIKTQDEIAHDQNVKSERELQKSISNLLRVHNIVFFSQRMDKRTRGQLGQPDFIFIVNGWFCAWEVKTATGKVSPEQEQIGKAIIKRKGFWHVVRSFADAHNDLMWLLNQPGVAV